ncbi:MAG: HU family DNA-binding protein [Clostridiales Family XIII bacterium]|nr:HU family DNA-binding protein [Clostridiales Family XIII bacterium]
MNKQELIAEVAAKSSVSKKDAETVVNNTIATITKTLKKGDKVQLIGFGTFETRKRKARKGRNPRKPEELISIPASTAPVFKAGKALKDAVSKKK